MNSSQINFFLTTADQASLMKHFEARGAFIVVHSRAQDNSVRLLKTAEIKKMGTEPLTVYLARPCDVGAVQLNVLQQQAYSTIDVVRSPVIQFTRCFHLENRPRRGRLYFMTAYYDGAVLIKKDGAF